MVQHITHTVQGVSPLTLTFDRHHEGHVIVILEGSGESKIDVTLLDNAKINLFYLNIGQSLSLNETYTLKKDSHLKINYADFNEAALNRNSIVELIGEGSNVILKSAILVQSHKELNYRFNHHARHSFGEMENFAVTLKEGSMNFHAVGHIHKTASQSETHQTTRILNFNSKERASVYPELIIDHNDVKASHAESSGQIDPDHLYYMQTRGLNSNDAIRLIVQGYLSSILDAIEDKALKETLQREIDQKVETVCSM